MSKYNIVIINPWIYDFASVNMWARPLGLLRVAEYLSRFDLNLSFIDCLDTFKLKRYNMGKYPKKILPTPKPLRGIKRKYGRYGITEGEFIERLKALKDPSLILLGSLMTYWYPGVKRVIEICKNLFPETPIVLGGIYATLLPEHASTLGADIVYRGRLSGNFLKILSELGIKIRKVRKAIPYYKMRIYRALPYAPILTSEGCPFRCTYCASGLLCNDYQRRSYLQIFKEIMELESLGAKDIAFYDDALLYKAEEHIKPLLREIIKRNLSLRFHTPNGLHARFIDRELAELMYRAGFKTLRLGLETTNKERQLKTGYKVKNDELARAVEYLKAAGFSADQIGVYLMFGLPGQMVEEVKEGIEFLKSLKVRISLTEFSPIPGTDEWQRLVEDGVIEPTMDPLLTNNTVFSILFTEFKDSVIRRLKEQVNNYNRSLQ